MKKVIQKEKKKKEKKEKKEKKFNNYLPITLFSPTINSYVLLGKMGRFSKHMEENEKKNFLEFFFEDEKDRNTFLDQACTWNDIFKLKSSYQTFQKMTISEMFSLFKQLISDHQPLFNFLRSYEKMKKKFNEKHYLSHSVKEVVFPFFTYNGSRLNLIKL